MSELRQQLEAFAREFESSLPTVEAEQVAEHHLSVAESRRRPLRSRLGIALASVAVLVGGIATVWLTRPPEDEVPAVTDPVVATTSASPDTSEAITAIPGAVVVGPGEPIQLRMLFSYTGTMRSVGIDQIAAVEVARDVFGTIHGHAIELGEPEDSFCSAEGALPAALSLAEEPELVGVLGTSCSYYYHDQDEYIPGFGYRRDTGARPTSPASILSEAGMILFSGTHSSASLTSDLRGNPGQLHQPGYFRTSPNDVVVAEAAAKFIVEELGLERVAVVFQEGYSGGFGDAAHLAGLFEELLEAGGGTVTDAVTVEHVDADLRPLLADLAEGDPDVVYVLAHSPQTIFMLEQADEIEGMGEKVFLGTEDLLWVHREDLLETPEADGMYFMSPPLPDVATVGARNTSYFQLLERYDQHTYTERPVTPYFASTYDATMILFSAIEEVSVPRPDGTLVIDRDDLREAISATDDFPGVTGTLSCDPFGDCGPQRVSVFQHRATLPNTVEVATYAPGG